ncbi:ATP-binding protein [Catellatospora sp. NPDC049609]|uniref:ATP-binding protein n=1 Tax=Catellatospora sp. NPDC049609 TaxID=3155505 RepID=UPI00341FF132
MNSADPVQDPSRPIARPAGLDVEFVADDLYTLRAAVNAHAAEFGLAEAGLSRLLVVATELATNAIRHGGGAGRLRLWRADGAIYCQVSDAGSGIADPVRAGTELVPLSEHGGRGLWVVRQFTDGFDITDGRPGAIVTVKITI